MDMVRERWLYSIVEYRAGRDAPLPFGVVLFRPGHEPVVQWLDALPAGLPGSARWMMGARALIARLRKANPQSKEEILAFLSLEGSEMRLSEPKGVSVIRSAVTDQLISRA